MSRATGMIWNGVSTELRCVMWEHVIGNKLRNGAKFTMKPRDPIYYLRTVTAVAVPVCLLQHVMDMVTTLSAAVPVPTTEKRPCTWVNSRADKGLICVKNDPYWFL